MFATSLALGSEARAVLAKAAAEARAAGHASAELTLLTDLVRLGGAAEAYERMRELGSFCQGRYAAARVGFADAARHNDPQELLACAEEFADMGALLLAGEAACAAAARWRSSGRNRRATAAEVLADTLLQPVSADVRPRTPLLVTSRTPAPLSRREEEVALMAAQGLSIREIAERLTLSVRTIENHLYSVYSKLGVDTRRALSEVMRVRKM